MFTLQEDVIKRRKRCEVLEVEITTLAGHLNAAEYRLIKLLDDFDVNKGWHGDGIKSFAHWLNWRIGMGHMMAREKVRVARALRELPMIDLAFSRGEVSYSKVRAMTRAATPANEKFLLQIAEYGTAQHMETLVKKYRLAKRLNDPLDEYEKSRQQKGCFWYQDDEGMYVFDIRLPAEEGMIVVKAIEGIADILHQESRLSSDSGEVIDWNEEEKVSAETQPVKQLAEDTLSENQFSEEEFLGGNKPDIFSHRADALTLLAEYSLSNDTDALFNTSKSDGCHVLLHVNANPMNLDYKINNGPLCHTDDNRYLSPEVAQRLSCDASVSVVAEDNDCNVISIGRKSRVVPSSMKRALKMRDQGCRFPACCQTKRVDAHHIHHWAQGGETSLNNLVSLCRYHHTLLHKGKYHIEQDTENTISFINRKNEMIPQSLYPQFSQQIVTLRKDDPTYSLESQHKDLGIDISHRTAITKWDGDDLDVHHAVQLMFQIDGRVNRPG